MLTLEEAGRFSQIGEEFRTFSKEQQTQQSELAAMNQAASTPEQKFEYAARLLAVVEKNTERLSYFTEELNKLVYSKLASCYIKL